MRHLLVGRYGTDLNLIEQRTIPVEGDRGPIEPPLTCQSGDVLLVGFAPLAWDRIRIDPIAEPVVLDHWSAQDGYRGRVRSALRPQSQPPA